MGLVIAGDGGMRGAVKNVSCEPGDKLRGIQRRQPIRCAETSRTWEYGYDRKPTKDLWTKPSYFIVGDWRARFRSHCAQPQDNIQLWWMIVRLNGGNITLAICTSHF